MRAARGLGPRPDKFSGAALHSGTGAGAGAGAGYCDAADPADDFVPCPHCMRTFSESTAERHIPKCKTIVARPKPPSWASSAHRGVGSGGGFRGAPASSSSTTSSWGTTSQAPNNHRGAGTLKVASSPIRLRRAKAGAAAAAAPLPSSSYSMSASSMVHSRMSLRGGPEPSAPPVAAPKNTGGLRVRHVEAESRPRTTMPRGRSRASESAAAHNEGVYVRASGSHVPDARSWAPTEDVSSRRGPAASTRPHSRAPTAAGGFGTTSARKPSRRRMESGGLTGVRNPPGGGVTVVHAAGMESVSRARTAMGGRRRPRKVTPGASPFRNTMTPADVGRGGGGGGGGGGWGAPGGSRGGGGIQLGNSNATSSSNPLASSHWQTAAHP